MAKATAQLSLKDRVTTIVDQLPDTKEALYDLREVEDVIKEAIQNLIAMAKATAQLSLKDRVTTIVDQLPDTKEALYDLREVEDVIKEAIRTITDVLLNSTSGDDAPIETEQPLPQPEILQLSEDEQLRIHLQRPETNATARNEWSTIQAALAKNTEFMQTLKVYENMGAELTIVEIETDDDGKITAVEFEDAADNLNVEAQEQALIALMEDSKTVNAYIANRSSQFDEADKADAETWMRKLLNRPANVSGLNYLEADMLLKHGGGQLISHDRLQKQAESKPELWENTVTWHHEDDLKAVKKSGFARNGYRDVGGARHDWLDAHYHRGIRGGRVSRLRVQIS